MDTHNYLKIEIYKQQDTEQTPRRVTPLTMQ